MKIKTPLDYELEKTYLARKLESCKFFSVGVTGFLVGIILLLSAMLYFCKTAHAGDNYVSAGFGNTQFEQNALGSGTWHQAPEYGTAFLPDSPARNEWRF